MEGSLYEELYVKPIEGLSWMDGAMRHGTEWVKILERFSPEIAYYYYRRLRDLKIDSLSATAIKIDDVTFPVYFKINAPFTLWSKKQNNLHSMLVTTSYPHMPVNHMKFIYPFEKVEELVDLPWLKLLEPDGRRNLSYEEAQGDTVKYLQRPKLDGNMFLQVLDCPLKMMVGIFLA